MVVETLQASGGGVVLLRLKLCFRDQKVACSEPCIAWERCFSSVVACISQMNKYTDYEQMYFTVTIVW